ncbi:GWxTD domain-containing protein, partial [candidate division KSB1 bacterium]|nr:GWxTD domain-containing protein [candidate division KSB1 bacterium]
SEVKKMRKAKGKEKSDMFEKFWSERDPTPGTEQNEHMEEYFRRVHYANEVFSGFREGWKSDMGMVYIILGHPNDIERHPFESGSKPYQVWYYYDINRKFVFVDETGFGEYRLLSEYWDDLFRDAGWRR